MTSTNWFEAWRAAERAANEAIRAAARNSMLAPEHCGGAASDAQAREAQRLREVADALFQRAMATMRVGTRETRSSRRLDYDDMWRMVLSAGAHTPASAPQFSS
jgi:hypothetical protein